MDFANECFPSDQDDILPLPPPLFYNPLPLQCLAAAALPPKLQDEISDILDLYANAAAIEPPPEFNDNAANARHMDLLGQAWSSESLVPPQQMTFLLRINQQQCSDAGIGLKIVGGVNCERCRGLHAVVTSVLPDSECAHTVREGMLVTEWCGTRLDGLSFERVLWLINTTQVEVVEIVVREPCVLRLRPESTNTFQLRMSGHSTSTHSSSSSSTHSSLKGRLSVFVGNKEVRPDEVDSDTSNSSSRRESTAQGEEQLEGFFASLPSGMIKLSIQYNRVEEKLGVGLIQVKAQSLKDHDEAAIFVSVQMVPDQRSQEIKFTKLHGSPALFYLLPTELAVVALRVTLWESIESKSTFRGEVLLKVMDKDTVSLNGDASWYTICSPDPNLPLLEDPFNHGKSRYMEKQKDLGTGQKDLGTGQRRALKSLFKKAVSTADMCVATSPPQVERKGSLPTAKESDTDGMKVMFATMMKRMKKKSLFELHPQSSVSQSTMSQPQSTMSQSQPQSSVSQSQSSISQPQSTMSQPQSTVTQSSMSQSQPQSSISQPQSTMSQTQSTVSQSSISQSQPQSSIPEPQSTMSQSQPQSIMPQSSISQSSTQSLSPLQEVQPSKLQFQSMHTQPQSDSSPPVLSFGEGEEDQETGGLEKLASIISTLRRELSQSQQQLHPLPTTYDITAGPVDSQVPRPTLREELSISVGTGDCSDLDTSAGGRGLQDNHGNINHEDVEVCLLDTGQWNESTPAASEHLPTGEPPNRGGATSAGDVAHPTHYHLGGPANTRMMSLPYREMSSPTCNPVPSHAGIHMSSAPGPTHAGIHLSSAPVLSLGGIHPTSSPGPSQDGLHPSSAPVISQGGMRPSFSSAPGPSSLVPNNVIIVTKQATSIDQQAGASTTIMFDRTWAEGRQAGKGKPHPLPSLEKPHTPQETHSSTSGATLQPHPLASQSILSRDHLSSDGDGGVAKSFGLPQRQTVGLPVPTPSQGTEMRRPSHSPRPVNFHSKHRSRSLNDILASSGEESTASHHTVGVAPSRDGGGAQCTGNEAQLHLENISSGRGGGGGGAKPTLSFLSKPPRREKATQVGRRHHGRRSSLTALSPRNQNPPPSLQDDAMPTSILVGAGDAAHSKGHSWYSNLFTRKGGRGQGEGHNRQRTGDLQKSKSTENVLTQEQPTTTSHDQRRRGSHASIHPSVEAKKADDRDRGCPLGSIQLAFSYSPQTPALLVTLTDIMLLSSKVLFSDFKVKMRLLHTSSGVCLMKHKSSLSYKRGVIKPNIEFQFCTDIQNLSLEVLISVPGAHIFSRKGYVEARIELNHLGLTENRALSQWFEVQKQVHVAA